MNLTLREILGFDAVAAGAPEVLVGADLLDRGVRWVHVAEVGGIGDLLQGGELILTTGLALAGRRADPRRFIQQLSRAGVAGLVVELGARLPEVPPQVVHEARHQRLPIIALRRTVRFVAITEAVHRRIVTEQYEDLAFAHRTHERFTSLTLTGADVGQIVATASELCGSPVVLEDVSHRVLAFAELDQPESQLLRDWEHRSRRASSSDHLDRIGPESWTAKSVGPAGSRWGRLIALAPTVDASRDAMVLDRAADALQLMRMVEQNRADLWVRAQESLIDDLAHGRIQHEVDAVVRADALRVRPGACYVPVAIRFHGSAQGSGIEDLQDLRRQTATVSRALLQSEIAAVVGRLGLRTLGLVLALDTAEEDSALRRLSEALRMGSTRDRAPVIGVASSSASLLTAGAHLHRAEHVVDAAAALTGRRPRSYYRATDVRLRGLVAQMRSDSRVQGFAESELRPLLMHDDEHDDNLVEVLRQFIACSGNKSRLAEATHRSRPAVYTALGRIEEVLGVSLDDPESVLSLGVALLVYDDLRWSQRVHIDQ